MESTFFSLTTDHRISFCLRTSSFSIFTCSISWRFRQVSQVARFDPLRALLDPDSRGRLPYYSYKKPQCKVWETYRNRGAHRWGSLRIPWWWWMMFLWCFWIWFWISLSLHRHLQESSESSKSLFVMIWSKVSYKFHVFTKSPRGAVAVWNVQNMCNKHVKRDHQCHGRWIISMV